MVFFLVALTVISLIGGSLQAESKFPYVVRICKDSVSLRCSGILISRNLVLTSSYCVNDTEEVRVYVGTTVDLCSMDYINDARTIKSKDFFKVSDFKTSTDELTFVNDLAVILLPMAVVESATVKVATLSEINLHELAGKEALISGWGPKVDLQYNTTRIQNENDCTTFGLEFIPIEHGCSEVDDRRKMYFLDSGSPLEYNGKIVGFKTNDRYHGIKILFVNIHNYLPFIREIQKNNPPKLMILLTRTSGYPVQNSWVLLVLIQVLSIYVFKF